MTFHPVPSFQASTGKYAVKSGSFVLVRIPPQAENTTNKSYYCMCIVSCRLSEILSLIVTKPWCRRSKWGRRESRRRRRQIVVCPWDRFWVPTLLRFARRKYCNLASTSESYFGTHIHVVGWNPPTENMEFLNGKHASKMLVWLLLHVAMFVSIFSWDFWANYIFVENAPV